MMGWLEGKVALVTGGASGLGLAIVERFVHEGATVMAMDRSRDKLEKPRADLGASVATFAGDVTSPADNSGAVAAALEAFGQLDVFVGNAGLWDFNRPLLGSSIEDTARGFDELFAVNVKGLFFTLQAVAKRMIARGRGGKIINMASQAGRRGEALVSIYCASKAAVISLTQSAGLDLIKHRINVNGIAPGVVDTPMWVEVDALFAKYEHRPIGEKRRLVGEAVPFGRMGLPNDHVGAAVFLASSDSDFVVAQTLNVDGGNWMS